MELTDYLGILRRWWWTLLVATWVAAISGFLIADRIPRVYEAEARLLVGPINTDLDTQRAAGQLAQTYAQLVTSQTLVDSVRRELPAPRTVSELQSAISAVPNDVTRLIDIRVDDGSPQMAATIANALADEIRNLALGSTGISRPEGEITVIDPAEVPTNAIAPQVSLITMVAALAGLLGAVVLVALIEYASNAIRSPGELALLTGVPALGSVVTAGRGGGGWLPAAVPESRAATDYRLLTAKLDLARGENPTRTLLIQGSSPGDGAGIVAANVAVILAVRGLRVAFIDANSEHGEASMAFGLSNEPGLGEAADGGPLITHSVEPAPNVVLTVVPQGKAGSEFARVAQVRDVLARLIGDAEIVVVAAPPAARSAGALLWAEAVDRVLLVVAKVGARRPVVASAVDSLNLVNAKLIGTVLAPPPRRRVQPTGLPLAIRRVVAQETRRQVLGRPDTVAPAAAAATSEPAPPVVRARSGSSEPSRRTSTTPRRQTPKS